MKSQLKISILTFFVILFGGIGLTDAQWSKTQFDYSQKTKNDATLKPAQAAKLLIPACPLDPPNLSSHYAIYNYIRTEDPGKKTVLGWSWDTYNKISSVYQDGSTVELPASSASITLKQLEDFEGTKGVLWIKKANSQDACPNTATLMFQGGYIGEDSSTHDLPVQLKNVALTPILGADQCKYDMEITQSEISKILEAALLVNGKRSASLSVEMCASQGANHWAQKLTLFVTSPSTDTLDMGFMGAMPSQWNGFR